MMFRNLTLKMSRAHYHYISFNVFSRPLNKLLFISVLHKLNNFSFTFPSLIHYHFKKRSRLRVYYQGFRLIFKKRKMGLLLKESTLIKHRFKRKRKLQIRHSRFYKLYYKRKHNNVTRIKSLRTLRTRKKL
jgi:hypothetical protein